MNLGGCPGRYAFVSPGASLFEPRHEKTSACIMRKQKRILAARLVTYIVAFLCFLNPKIQVSSHLLRFVSNLVGDHEGRFSHGAAHSATPMKYNIHDPTTVLYRLCYLNN